MEKKDVYLANLSKNRLDAILSVLPDLCFIISEDGTFIEHIVSEENKALVFGGEAEVIGKTVSSIFTKSLSAQITHTIETAINKNRTMTLEYELELPDGIFWFEARCAPLKNYDSKSNAVVWLTRDVTDRKILEIQIEEQNQALEKLSVTDQLTGLFNRKRLNEAFANEFSRSLRLCTFHTMILLDIDYFKRVNDRYGHNVGDTTLQSIARILEHTVRSTDVVGRWGGEEFVVICPATDIAGGYHLAEQIRLAVERHEFPVVGGITCSFGVAQARAGEEQEEFVERADRALYKAKENGRNRVECAVT